MLLALLLAGCVAATDADLAESQPTQADTARADTPDELGTLCGDEDCAPELRARFVEALLDDERYAEALPHLEILVGAGAPCDTLRTDAQEDLLWVHSQLRDRDAVASAARRIAGDCPTATVAAHAWMLVGERAFEEAQLDVARAAYQRSVAVARGRAAIHAYAWYKLAWVHFNLMAWDEAELAFEQAWTLAEREDPEALLAREARRDAVRVLVARDLDATTAVERIGTIGRTPEEAARLAQRYEDQLRDAALVARADAFVALWRTR